MYLHKTHIYIGRTGFCCRVTLTYSWDLQCWLSAGRENGYGNRCWLLLVVLVPSPPFHHSCSASAASLLLFIHSAAASRHQFASSTTPFLARQFGQRQQHHWGDFKHIGIGIVVRFSANELNSNEHIWFYSRLMKVLQGYNGLIFCHVCFRRVTNVTIGHGGGQ